LRFFQQEGVADLRRLPENLMMEKITNQVIFYVFAEKPVFFSLPQAIFFCASPIVHGKFF